jgi:PAS domain S-box-containing protein
VLIQEAMAFIGAQSGCSGIYTPQGMVCHKYFQDDRVLPLEYCWPVNHGLPGWLIVHKVPYLTNDALADPQIVHELCLQFGVRSARSTPILDAHGDLLGFFELHNKRGESGFTSSDQQALLALSHLASIALQNALTFERLHRTEQALRQARDALEFQVAQRTAALAHTNEVLQREIIERQRAEEHLLQTQHHLQSVLNHAPLILWSVDRHGLYTLSEGKGLEVLGLKPGEIVGQSHYALYQKAPDLVAHVKRALQGEAFTAEAERQGHWYETHYTPVKDEGGTITDMVGVSIDITERKKAEEERRQLIQRLQAERALLEEVLRQMPAGVVIAEAPTGRVILRNRRAEQLLHFSVPPAQQDQDLQGKTFHLDGTPITDEDWALGRALTKGEVVIGEERLYVRRDGTSCYLRISAAPVKDSQGNIIAGVLSFYDITEQKELEQRKDEFISMASHELKTPITSLKGFTQVFLPRFKTCDDEEYLRLLTDMDGQINHLTRLVNDLLDVSKMRVGHLEYRKEPFDLDGLVQEIVENVQRTTPTHRLVLAKQAHVGVFGDRERIGQALTNLLTNAVKYSPQADRVLIRMAQDEQQVIVNVQDFGVGIARAH